MPTVAYPQDESIQITYPDEWLMRHLDQYRAGLGLAVEGLSIQTRELYAAIALCTEIRGIETDPKKIAALPISYFSVFEWLRRTVLDSYYSAIEVPKNS